MVKHCPNPDCPIVADGAAASEYSVTVESCADCGARLVAGPAPPPAPGPGPAPYDGRLVTIAVSRGQDDVSYTRHLLEVAGIPSFVQGEQARAMLGGATATRVLVREEDAERATALVDRERTPAGDDGDPFEAPEDRGALVEQPRSMPAWWAWILFGLVVGRIVYGLLR